MYFPNESKKMRVKILTVDPRSRRVEGLLKDGIPIPLAVWEIGPFFRWPREGEEWTAIYENNFWRLGDYVTDESDTALNSLMPGEARIDSDKLYIAGEAYAPTAPVNTDTTQIATTAFVLGQASNTTPAFATVGGTAGTSARLARADHAHPRNAKYETHTWILKGPVATDYIPSIFCAKQTSETLVLQHFRGRINGGTSVDVVYRKISNGVATDLEYQTLTTAAANSPEVSVLLQNNDEIQVIVQSITGSPVDASITAVFSRA